MEQIKTTYIREQIRECESLNQLKSTILPLLKEQKEQWKQKINSIITKMGISNSSFAKMCGVTRGTVGKWCNEGALPRGREVFIKIGLSAGYNRVQINNLLTRYGRYSELYSKSPGDCVCIYVIEHFKENRVESYNRILEEIQYAALGSRNRDFDMSTVKVESMLHEINEEQELKQFIFDNSNIFASSYQKLYANFDAQIKENIRPYSNDDGVEMEGSIHHLESEMGLSPIISQSIYDIKNYCWDPSRDKIIAIGIDLGMNHDQIDKMLGLAHMEKLCARNIHEAVIMYILDSADANLPPIENEGSFAKEIYIDSLRDYAKYVIEELGLSEEMSDFLSNIGEKEGNRYERE